MQIVHKNTMIALIDKVDEQAITDFEMFDETETRENETFYVNVFFSNSVEEFEIAEGEVTPSQKRD